MRLPVLLSAIALGSAAGAGAPAPVVFHWFEYSGQDRAAGAPLPEGSYRNPVLAGFYPDPGICRVGEDYYLVNSSFAWFPGIPIFHSRDLVHWTQIGSVLSRPAQLPLAGLGVSRGVFAPAISHHGGRFYVINTLVDAGGNFFVTATNPAGPWSDPVWLPEIDGIDPSFFFDVDGRAYVVNNGPPPGNHPLYEGHRAIWIQEFDVATQKLTGPREIIVNGGTDLARHPVWIEGPHLFQRDGWYYLICAEGGTAEDHSEVVFRSRAVRGPYVPWERNPILTQRDLPAGRPDPVTCTGHADFVTTPDGAWWAVFLGCEPYADNFYNTGRETFLLPVTWTRDGWPLILPPREPVPRVVAAPRLPATPPSIPLNGNFTWRDDFAGPALAPVWESLRGPPDAWLSLTQNPGALTLLPRPDRISGSGAPAFIARRQQNADCTATTELRLPVAAGVSAGLVAFQNETYHFFLGVRARAGGAEVFLERAAGGAATTVATADLPGPAAESLRLRITLEGGVGAFAYAVRAGPWRTLRAGEDATILSTRTAGGFVGTMLGLYARRDRSADAH
jgi:xylan 1,4-beta-xylosidase